MKNSNKYNFSYSDFDLAEILFDFNLLHKYQHINR